MESPMGRRRTGSMHLKRYSMPGFWPVPRKTKVYVTTPMPGPHPKQRCIPLRIIVRDVLKLTQTTPETKRVLNSGKVMVDKKMRKEPGFPVGFMDVVELPQIGARFRVNMDKRGLVLEKIGEAEASSKLCKITSKRIIRGGLTQIGLHDGRCLISKNPFRVGDSLLIEIPGQAIIKHFPLKKGEHAVIIAGRNQGAKGKIKGMNERESMLEKGTITIETEKGREIETLSDYVMVGSLAEGEAPSEEDAPAKKRKAKEKGE